MRKIKKELVEQDFLNSALKKYIYTAKSASESSECIFFFVFISSFVSFAGVYIYVQYFFESVRKQTSETSNGIIFRDDQKKTINSLNKCHVNALQTLTNENHFPKNTSQQDFGYGLLAKLLSLIVVRDFSPSSFKLKTGILPR